MQPFRTNFFPFQPLHFFSWFSSEARLNPTELNHCYKYLNSVQPLVIIPLYHILVNTCILFVVMAYKIQRMCSSTGNGLGHSVKATCKGNSHVQVCLQGMGFCYLPPRLLKGPWAYVSFHREGDDPRQQSLNSKHTQSKGRDARRQLGPSVAIPTGWFEVASCCGCTLFLFFNRWPKFNYYILFLSISIKFDLLS